MNHRTMWKQLKIQRDNDEIRPPKTFDDIVAAQARQCAEYDEDKPIFGTTSYLCIYI